MDKMRKLGHSEPKGTSIQSKKDREEYYSVTITSSEKVKLWFGQRCVKGLILSVSYRFIDRKKSAFTDYYLCFIML
jgi:hypothetical protein